MASKSSIQAEMKSFLEENPFLRQILLNLTQVVWLQDIKTDRFLYISPAFETVWKRSVDSLYADPQLWINSVHPEDRVQVMNSRFRNNHKPFYQTYRIIHEDDSFTWIFSSSFYINDPAYDTEYLFCIADDISEKKDVEAALRNTLDRTREQFDLSRKMSLARKPESVLRSLLSAKEMRLAQRAALVVFDEVKEGPIIGDETITLWTSTLVKSNWPGESRLYEETGLWDLFHATKPVVINEIQSDSRLTKNVRDILVEGHVKTLAVFPLTALGEWRGCLLVFFPVQQRFDYLELRYLKVLVDQAAITLYNLQLLKNEEESRHEAERANEIKTEFLAMISHELRTPLTSIVGFTSTLLADDVIWQANDQKDFILTIQQEANRLQELIDHLLDLSQLEAEMLPIVLQTCSLRDILNDAEPQLNSLTTKHTLTVQIPPRLPLMMADSRRLAQILVNLVKNASTYTPEGSEITISANARGGFVQINVRDEGPGIPAADHRKVFKAFTRGEEAEKNVPQGAGLGLAICKGLVLAHGGRIWIRTKNTPGATISFTIPVVPLNAQAAPDGEES